MSSLEIIMLLSLPSVTTPAVEAEDCRTIIGDRRVTTIEDCVVAARALKTFDFSL